MRRTELKRKPAKRRAPVRVEPPVGSRLVRAERVFEAKDGREFVQKRVRYPSGTVGMRRESGFNWDAANPYSSAGGVYQFVSGTWASQVSSRRGFINNQHLSTSVWNARSSVLIAIKLAHGCWCWAPWGG